MLLAASALCAQTADASRAAVRAGFVTPQVFALAGLEQPALFAEAQKAGRPFPYANHNADNFVDLAANPVGARLNTAMLPGILAKP